LAVAKKKTAEADVKLDDRGKPIVDEEELELGDNCIIVSQQAAGLPAVAEGAVDEARDEKPTRGRKKKPVVEKQTVEKPAAPKKTPEKPPKKPAKRRK